MRRIKLRFVVIAIGLGLGLPAAAGAQSAGDDQYADPFEETPAQNAPADRSGDDDTSPPAAATPVADTAAPAAADAGAGSEQLPRTGLDLVMLLVTGAVLALSGFTVRRVLAGPYAAAR